MEYLIGVVLASVVAGFVTMIGLDRGRAFYTTVLMVVASYYVLFAVVGASNRSLGMEIAVFSGFSLLAILGFTRNFWLVAAGLVGHGVFDFVHHAFVKNPGMPLWWPGFCLAFDVLAGGWLAIRLMTRSVDQTQPGRPTI
jgi:hypothetical protein